MLATLQSIATVAPALYTGITFAYTHIVIPPIIAHAPTKVLAQQWLFAYKVAPPYVTPLVLAGAFSNATLAYLSAPSSSRASRLYALAALIVASVVPYTIFFMEAGINGAAKWKVQELLGKDEVKFKGKGVGTEMDSATDRSKRWAEKTDIKTIVELWGNLNFWRYVLTGLATIISAIATIVKT